MSQHRSRVVVSCLAVVAVLTCAAGGATLAAESRSIGLSATEAHVAPLAARSLAAAGSHEHGHDLPSTPAGLRLHLEELLGHHAILMARRMRGGIDGDTDFVVAAKGVLDRNTDGLTAAVSSVYGTRTGAGFKEAWNQHIAALAAYGDALAAGDRERLRTIRAELDAYAAQYGQLISSVTDGRLDSAAVARDVAAHVGHLLMHADAYAAQDYGAAFRIERQAYAAMFSTGKNLAGAMAMNPSGELPAAFDSQPERLRSALGLLLGEHSELAFDATRAVVAGDPAAQHVATALDGNTRDVIAAMQAALGDEAAARFSDVWAQHIDALVAFSVAVAEGDVSAQASARRRLDDFPGRLGALLGPLAAGRVQNEQVLGALQLHDQHLLQQVTAYAAGDYVRAHDIAYTGYHHMFAIAGTLAEVLEGRAEVTAPRGGAATGGGGLAPGSAG